jgi:hypothetical protein
MAETVIQHVIPTLLNDEVNKGEDLVVEIFLDDDLEGAIVKVGGYKVEGKYLIRLGEIIERNLD